jgi:hypothetical protein
MTDDERWGFRVGSSSIEPLSLAFVRIVPQLLECLAQLRTFPEDAVIFFLDRLGLAPANHEYLACSLMTQVTPRHQLWCFSVRTMTLLFCRVRMGDM